MNVDHFCFISLLSLFLSNLLHEPTPTSSQIAHQSKERRFASIHHLDTRPGVLKSSGCCFSKTATDDSPSPLLAKSRGSESPVGRALCRFLRKQLRSGARGGTRHGQGQTGTDSGNPATPGQWTADSGRWTVDGGRWTVDGRRWTVYGVRWTVNGRRWAADVDGGW